MVSLSFTCHPLKGCFPTVAVATPGARLGLMTPKGDRKAELTVLASGAASEPEPGTRPESHTLPIAPVHPTSCPHSTGFLDARHFIMFVSNFAGHDHNGIWRVITNYSLLQTDSNGYANIPTLIYLMATCSAGIFNHLNSTESKWNIQHAVSVRVLLAATVQCSHWDSGKEGKPQ